MSRKRNMKPTAKAAMIPQHLSLAQLLTRRLGMVALWYVTLALPFLLILAWVSTYEPEVVAFLVGDGTSPDLTMFMTPAEASHMEDMRVLVRDAMLLLLSAVIVLVTTSVVQPLERGQFRAVLVMHGTVLLLLLPFPWTFAKFHEVFFPQGNWQFPADSYLISTFSGTFFAIAAFTWMGLSLGIVYTLYKTNEK
jgi:uncharacterized membrane protein